MASRRSWRIPALILSLVATVFLAASVPASAEGRGPSDDSRASVSLDAASSAIPTVAQPLVTDSANARSVLQGSGRKAVATAVATSGCGGCSGTATTLQTVSVQPGGAAIADNVATAWSSCASCSSSAISVQIVTGPSVSTVQVNNRSLALNAGCSACTTTAVALQFVVVGGTQRELTATTKSIIQQIEHDLGVKLTSPAAQKAAASMGPSARREAAQHDADDAAARAKSAISSDLRPAQVGVRVEVQAG
ncbi:hypothetical protein [Sinomonas susongensis]|uniref:hypothetical protein n=1 Tax=Sinomonas susongensis TaxID=1324851 RepID=UPI001107F319|nr:hypothetical protein [Sinomonas susongensis]